MADKDAVMASEQVLQVPFVYSAGPVASRFLIGLRDERKVYGQKCLPCRKVHVPARARCGWCGEALTEWVEVGPMGTLMNFTVVHYSEPVHPAAAPFVIGVVRLDGADTCLVHVVRAEPETLKVGLRVQPQWARERRGHVLDLEAYLPA